MQWNDRYSVGMPVFDQHHRRLFGLIDELQAAMKTGHGKDKMAKILNELVAYTQMHFTVEENAMMKAGYGNFAAHKSEHDKFKSKVFKFQEDFQSGAVAMSVEVLQFLNKWLLEHIMVTDKQYSSALK